MKLQIRKGYTIFEFFVYLFLLSLLSICMLQGVLYIQNNIRQWQHSATQIMAAYAASDALARDIQTAPSPAYSWMTSSDQLFWYCPVDQKTYSWFVANVRLQRRVGHYNYTQACWERQQTSSVAYGIIRIACSYQYDVTHQHVTAISYELLTTTSLHIKRTVAVPAIR